MADDDSEPVPAVQSRPARRSSRPASRAGRCRVLISSYFLRTERERVRELAELHRLKQSELIRRAVLGLRLPDPIPRANLEAWARLGPLAADLNRYVRAIDEDRADRAALPLLLSIRELLDELRQELRGRRTTT
jgi:hypothetical protein